MAAQRAETAGKLDRRDALAAMFHALDVNGDGRVSLDEATRAACGVCPTMTESEVDECLGPWTSPTPASWTSPSTSRGC